MKKEEALRKIRSIKLCLMAHPDNEPDSEFADRISDCEELEQCATQQAGTVEKMADALKRLLAYVTDIDSTLAYHNLSVVGWWLNGDHEPIMSFFDNMDTDSINEGVSALAAHLASYQPENTGSNVKEAGDGWISVIDRLPEDGEAYLIFGMYGDIELAIFHKKTWLDFRGESIIVTHWQLLPQAPKSKP